MFPKDQYSSLIYQPQDRPRRPQTPLGNNNNNSFSRTQYNRSFSKNAPLSPHYSNTQNLLNKPYISKSRVSVASSASQLQFLNSDQGEIFPQDLIFLLKNQEKNINNFKQKIERQKNRVENDFSILKKQIQHVLQDLKLSFQAQLDLVYKTFITKYAEVKGQVQEIRRLRKQILIANNAGSSQIHGGKDTSSNSDIVSQIEKDAEHFRNYRVYGYLTEMQKQKITPILELCTELILIGSADCPFYRSKEMGIKAKNIKAEFSSVLSQVFNNIQNYVVSPQSIIQKEKQEQENANMILKQMQQENQKNIFDVQYPQNRQSPPKHDFQIPKKPSRPVSHGWQEPRTTISKVSGTQKTGIVKWVEQISLRKTNRVVTDHQDAILCMFFIDGKYIATGSKDKTINVYSLDGKKVTTLRGHQASICTLSAVYRQNGNCYLASGSDHGCCCLILWDNRSWTISSRIQSHVAAVTCILDLGDGQHLITGSYDKHINIFNHSKGQLLSSNNNKSPVTSLALTSDKRKLVSSCLQNYMTVWDIRRTANGIVLQAGANIKNDSIICIMEPSLLRPQVFFAATRNGKIKIYNLQGNQPRVQKSFMVNENSIIQLAVLQREMQSQTPIIFSCSSKDKSLCMTKMDTGMSDMIKINGPFNVQFGCGIGPKIIMDRKDGGTMAILSQSTNAKQFSLFEMVLR